MFVRSRTMARLLALTLVSFAAVLRANIILAPLFTDGAVLQRDKEVPIWGQADPGEAVTVAFHTQTVRAIAGPDGRWIVLLESEPASLEGADLTVTAKKGAVTLHDVVVGEVWLCSGQSNMEFTVTKAMNATQEIANAHFPLIRHIEIERQESDAPTDRGPTAGWRPATPEN